MSYAELLAVKKNVSVELNRAENNIVGDEKNMWRNGFVSMNVYYKSQVIEVITERPQTQIEEFISELGGTLGLFLGISFLSFVELVEIVFELIVLKVERRRRVRHHGNNLASSAAAASIVGGGGDQVQVIYVNEKKEEEARQNQQQDNLIKNAPNETQA